MRYASPLRPRSLKGHLVGLAAALGLPLLGLQAWFAYREYHAALAESSQEALALADANAERARLFRRMWDRKAALQQAVGASRHLSAAPYSGNAFVFARIEGDDLSVCRRLLAERGYFVYPGSLMGERGKSHVCLVCLHSEELLSAGVEAIDALLESV